MNTFMNTLTLCITCYDADYHLLPDLLKRLEKQTAAPTDILIAASNLLIDRFDNIPKSLQIDKKNIPINIVSNQYCRLLPGGIRNVGAECSISSHIMFFDIDDVPHNQMIQIVTAIFNKYNCDAVLHNYVYGFDYVDQVENNYSINTITAETIVEKDRSCTNLICNNDPIHHGHITIKRDIVNRIKYNEGRSLGEDGEFCQAVFDKGYTIKYYKNPLVFYRGKK